MTLDSVSVQQNTTQTCKNSLVKKACPTILIHQSQFQLRNSHSWFYNKRSHFLLVQTEVLVVVSQVIGKEGCPKNGMKVRNLPTQPGCLCILSFSRVWQKQSSVYLQWKPAQNSVQNWWGTLLDLGIANRGPFPVPCCLEQITYWRTADRGHDRTLMNQEGTLLGPSTYLAKGHGTL
jgi:hypothetical protein